MAGTQTISIFTPLLFLVVMELSNIARDINLKNAVNREYRPFILGFWPAFSQAIDQTLSVPRLGHFNFIHGANFVLLSLGIFLIRWLSTGRITLVLAIMVWLVWVLLPLFEVGEYEEILNRRRPWSFLIHGVFATITAIYVILNPEVVGILSSANIPYLSEEPDNWSFHFYVMLVLFSNHQFLIQLEKEVKEISKSQSA